MEVYVDTPGRSMGTPGRMVDDTYPRPLQEVRPSEGSLVSPKERTQLRPIRLISSAVPFSLTPAPAKAAS
jgi:hypothetical protein